VAGYGYDNANRLTDLSNLTASGGQVIASYHFTLDGNGNRVHSSQTTPIAPAVSDADKTLTYNPTKTRLVTAGTSSFTYDNEGQLATGYGKTYSFDYEHRLIGVSGSCYARTYSYDGAGNRLQANRDGVITRYIYDINGNLIAEADDNNIISRYYIHGAGLMAMVTSDNSLYCYHFDATGHTVALTNAGKTVVNKYAYTPFGLSITGQTEAIAQPFKYAGQHGVMAESNGFYYMRARYYDPQVKRFISEDPLGFDGGDLNLYAYVGNNPVMGVDPLGLRTWSLGISSSAGLGVGGGGGTFLNVGHDSSKGLLEGWSASMTVTAGAGAYGGIGAGTQVQATITDACNVSQLNGAGMALGSSAGAGIQGGAEYVTNIGGTVKGASYYLGYGTRSTYASPVSTYAFGTTTSPIFSISQGK
jgi:RHS repeat-associated protein